MKSHWNKFLLFFLISLFLGACIGNTQEANLGQFDDIYPSQFLFGDVYILKDHELIDGNIAGVGTKLIIEEGATVTGTITLISGQMEIFGNVDGDINVFSGNIFIHDSAVIGGNVNQFANNLEINPDAHIVGEINTFTLPDETNTVDTQQLSDAIKWIRPSVWIIFELMRNLSLIFINVLIVFLFKIPTLRLTRTVTKNIAVAWGIGLLVFFAMPFTALILIISICLSPIGLLLILAFLIANVWAWTGISLIVGNLLTGWLKMEWTEAAKVAVGSVLIGLISTSLAFFPLIGLVLNITISAIGVGGIILSKIGTAERTN